MDRASQNKMNKVAQERYTPAPKKRPQFFLPFTCKQCGHNRSSKIHKAHMKGAADAKRSLR